MTNMYRPKRRTKNFIIVAMTTLLVGAPGVNAKNLVFEVNRDCISIKIGKISNIVNSKSKFTIGNFYEYEKNNEVYSHWYQYSKFFGANISKVNIIMKYREGRSVNIKMDFIVPGKSVDGLVKQIKSKYGNRFFYIGRMYDFTILNKIVVGYKGASRIHFRLFKVSSNLTKIHIEYQCSLEGVLR